VCAQGLTGIFLGHSKISNLYKLYLIITNVCGNHENCICGTSEVSFKIFVYYYVYFIDLFIIDLTKILCTKRVVNDYRLRSLRNRKIHSFIILL